MNSLCLKMGRFITPETLWVPAVSDLVQGAHTTCSGRAEGRHGPPPSPLPPHPSEKPTSPCGEGGCLGRRTWSIWCSCKFGVMRENESHIEGASSEGMSPGSHCAGFEASAVPLANPLQVPQASLFPVARTPHSRGRLTLEQPTTLGGGSSPLDPPPPPKPEVTIVGKFGAQTFGSTPPPPHSTSNISLPRQGGVPACLF